MHIFKYITLYLREIKQNTMNIENNQFKIQGVSVEELVENYGSPVYVYNTDTIASQIDRLKQAFKGQNLKLKYAIKALTNLSILKFIKSQGVGADVVSIQEVDMALLAGWKAEEILYTPNCVAFDEVKAGVDKGVFINIDNLYILEEFGKEYGNEVPCCIRINPHIMAGGNTKISTGHVGSKFGISIHQLNEVVEVVNQYNIDLQGLHIHTGSDILDAEVFLKMADILFNTAEKFKNIKFLDFGSGFKVGYKQDDITTNIEELGERLGEAFTKFCKKIGKELELWFEPGKFLVSDSGTMLAKTNVVKTTPAKVFVGVDSGLNHLIRPMMYNAFHAIINASNPAGKERVYTIVGNICETDTFGEDRLMHEVRQGDIIAFKNAGAYGFSMASNYNSRFRPCEVMVHKGKAHLIRKREVFEDLIKNQVVIDL